MHLSSYLKQSGITGAAFAETIGVTQQAVSQYVTRERTPRPEIMRRIVAATDGAVTANDLIASAAEAAPNTKQPEEA